MKRFTVLIPLDGSALSQRVLDTVGRLFDPQRYALLVLRVADTPAAVLAAPPRPLAVGNAWVDVYELGARLQACAASDLRRPDGGVRSL